MPVPDRMPGESLDIVWYYNQCGTAVQNNAGVFCPGTYGTYRGTTSAAVHIYNVPHYEEQQTRNLAARCAYPISKMRCSALVVLWIPVSTKK